jgi:hypothetical protein
MSEKAEGGSEHQERPAPAPEPVERQAADHEGKSVNLSIEEKGMVVMPEVPVPTNEVKLGDMPSADAGPGGGGSGSEAGGSEGGGSAGDSGE